MLHARIKGQFFRFIYIWVFIIIIVTESKSKMPLNKMDMKRKWTLLLILRAIIKDSKLQPKTHDQTVANFPKDKLTRNWGNQCTPQLAVCHISAKWFLITKKTKNIYTCRNQPLCVESKESIELPKQRTLTVHSLWQHVKKLKSLF